MIYRHRERGGHVPWTIREVMWVIALEEDGCNLKGEVGQRAKGKEVRAIIPQPHIITIICRQQECLLRVSLKSVTPN